MPYINLPDSLMRLHRDYDTRLQKLETGKRFTIPSMATDPTIYRVGDMWINTTSGLTKYVDKNGTIQTFGASTASAPFSPRYIKTGYAYGSIVPATISTSSLPSNNSLYCTPIYIPATASATQIGIYVSTLAGTTSMGVRLGLYTNSATDDYPNALVAGTDQYIETSSTFGSIGWNLNIFSSPISLAPGLYWLASVRQAANAPTTQVLNAGTAGNSPIPALTIAGLNQTPNIAYVQNSVTGALPATFTATKTTFNGVVHQVVLGF